MAALELHVSAYAVTERIMVCAVTYEARPELSPIEMSNGLTAVLVETIAVSASHLATTERHRELAVWFASHDQSVLGLGMVGFDVGELPWSQETFDADRAFVLAAIAGARSRLGWSHLGYAPREDWTFACLDRLHAMISAFAIEHRAPHERVWNGGRENLRTKSYELCEVHHVFRHAAGCILCNARIS